MALKQRRGRRGGRFPDQDSVRQLREAWEACVNPRDLFASLLPARLVTLTEVFCRYWIQKLIDHGLPYDERAIDLKVNIKYDLPLIRSLQGQKMSVGFLLSHNVALSEIATINAIFSTLIGTDFFQWLAKVQPRLMFDHDPLGDDRIVTDIIKLKRVIARLFEVRHILVHEFPEEQPLDVAEIDEMIEAVDTFINAADEGFSQLLHGLYPVNQQDMNRAAREASRAVDQELEKLINEVAKGSQSETIRQVQQAWRAFAEAEAERSAEDWVGGTGHPLVYYSALRALTSDRLHQLQTWVEEMLQS
ncbi:hypothetical protein UB31_08605 [Bradyrhizobium sp. LTSP849]|nr:hypothetical protein UB31_08605 [Bradyrhizobium sp. LTSP849]